MKIHHIYHDAWAHLDPVEDVPDGGEPRAIPRLGHHLLDAGQLAKVEVPLPLQALERQLELHQLQAEALHGDAGLQVAGAGAGSPDPPSGAGGAPPV